jgi:hypothetical protein
VRRERPWPFDNRLLADLDLANPLPPRESTVPRKGLARLVYDAIRAAGDRGVDAGDIAAQAGVPRRDIGFAIGNLRNRNALPIELTSDNRFRLVRELLPAA